MTAKILVSLAGLGLIVFVNSISFPGAAARRRGLN